jgi:hypothetical protein
MHLEVGTEYYSKSLRFGLREGSLDKKPKINKDEKKITVAYTKIFNVNICKSSKKFNLLK